MGSGPYTLKSFDGVTAEFESNSYYPGNADGEMPLIPHLTYTLADNETMIGKLESGEFDLLNKVLRADTITQGLQQMAAGGISMSNYPRTGLSYVAFACEKPAVSSQAVRQAIAYCMDRDALTEAYSGGFGIRVDGYYGIGQWMYLMANGTLLPGEEDLLGQGVSYCATCDAPLYRGKTAAVIGYNPREEAEAAFLADSPVKNLSRYRVRTLPAAGALLRPEDRGEKQLSLLED